MSGEIQKVACGFCCVVLIVMGICIGLSFKKLQATEVGLGLNTYTGNLNEDRLYTTGVSFLGITSKFIIFQKDTQAIRFEGAWGGETISDGVHQESRVMARSKDGLLVQLDVNLQYTVNLDIANLVSIYRKYKDQRTRFFAKIVRSALRDVASDFTANAFRNRTNIQKSMEAELIPVLRAQGLSYTQVQFLSYDLPVEFQRAIEETMNVQQTLQIAIGARQEMLQNLQTQRINANITKQGAIVKKTVEGESYALKRSGEASVVESRLYESAEALKTVRDTIFPPRAGGTSRDADLLAYAWLQELGAHSSGSLMLSLDSPEGVKFATGGLAGP